MNLAICDNMDGFRRFYAKWDVTENIWYDLSQIWNLKTNKQTSLFIQRTDWWFLLEGWVGEMDGGDQMVERIAITRTRGGQFIWTCLHILR